MKKTISIIITTIVLTSFFMACGGGTKTEDKEQTAVEKLDGKWKIVEATGEWAELNVGTVYTFGDDDAFSTSAGISVSHGTITAKDDKSFTVKFDGLQSDFVYEYSFDGENMIIELGSSDQVFTLEKQ